MKVLKGIIYIVGLSVLIGMTACGQTGPSFEGRQAQAEADLKAERAEREQKRLEAEKKALEEKERQEAEARKLEAERLKKPKSPLSGLAMEEDLTNRRSVGIMISNIEHALPQSGIEDAEVIYETLAEGGITRLFALFHEFDNQKIGPVRSSRHYFLDFALDHDAIYLHAGQSPQAQVAIEDLNIPAINSISYLSNIAFFLDPNRKRPHSTYTSYEMVMKGWESKQYRMEPNQDKEEKLHFSQDKEILLAEGEDITFLKLPYSYIDSPYFTYDSASKEYLRFQFGKPHLDVESGNQLRFTNIILQYVNMYAIAGDSAGRLDMDLIGKGKGFFFTRGKSIPITWSKEAHMKTTHYYDERGKEIELNPGKTWIAVYPASRVDLIEMDGQADQGQAQKN